MKKLIKNNPESPYSLNDLKNQINVGEALVSGMKDMGFDKKTISSTKERLEWLKESYKNLKNKKKGKKNG